MPAVHPGHASEDLRRFAREHHVSYDVAVDPPAPAAPQPTFEVRLFATHGDDKLEAPMCPRCTEVSRELHSFARTFVDSVQAEGWTEIMDPPPVLYAPTRGPDEVSLLLHVMGEGRERAAASDEHIRTLEHGLKALGVPRR